MLKKISSLLFLLFFLSFGKSFAQNNLSDKFEILYNPQKYPTSARFYDASGNEVLLSDFHGKVIILNFWKATRRTCLIELPSLNNLAKKYPQIIVLAISEGEEEPEFIDRILHKERRLNNISVSLDKEQRMLNLLGGGKVPQTHLIDKDGTIRGLIKGGADFNSKELQKQIESFM